MVATKSDIIARMSSWMAPKPQPTPETPTVGEWLNHKVSLFWDMADRLRYPLDGVDKSNKFLIGLGSLAIVHYGGAAHAPAKLVTMTKTVKSVNDFLGGWAIWGRISDVIKVENNTIALFNPRKTVFKRISSFSLIIVKICESGLWLGSMGLEFARKAGPSLIRAAAPLQAMLPALLDENALSFLAATAASIGTIPGGALLAGLTLYRIKDYSVLTASVTSVIDSAYNLWNMGPNGDSVRPWLSIAQEIGKVTIVVYFWFLTIGYAITTVMIVTALFGMAKILWDSHVEAGGLPIGKLA